MEGMLKPDTKEEVTGQVEVRNTFKVPKVGVIAGCYVTEGVVKIINDIPNIEKVEPMTHCLDRCIDHLREDEVSVSPSIDDILSNCDDSLTDQVKVPKVVE